MTRDQALTMNVTCFWRRMKPRDFVIFQLSVDRMCCPPVVLHDACCRVFRRAPTGDELNQKGRLLVELLGGRPPLTRAELAALLPEDARDIFTKEE
jgi:hypothetical protein